MYVLRCYWWVLGRRYFISFLIIYLSLSALRFPFFFFPKLKFTDFLICFPTFFNPAFIIIFYISFSVSYTVSYSSLVLFPTLSSCLMLSLSWPVKNLSSPVIFISPILSVRLSSHVSQQSPLALATVLRDDKASGENTSYDSLEQWLTCLLSFLFDLFRLHNDREAQRKSELPKKQSSIKWILRS